MRRMIAAYFALLGGANSILGTVMKSVYGFYSAVLCVVAVLVILGYTTVSDWKEIAAKVVGKR